jgi:hypothetical protein
MNKIPQELVLPPSNYINLQEVHQLVQKIQMLADHQKTPPQTEEVKVIGVMDPIFHKEIISLITNLWRTKSRINDSASGEPKEELKKEDIKKISRYLDSMFEGLKNMGFELRDRTGESFSYGMTEKVIASEPQEGISSEIIIETLKPTIYWKANIVQLGEVVIATPPTEKK